MSPLTLKWTQHFLDEARQNQANTMAGIISTRQKHQKAQEMRMEKQAFLLQVYSFKRTCLQTKREEA